MEWISIIVKQTGELQFGLVTHREMLQLSKVWTREQEEELKELFQRYKDEEGASQCDCFLSSVCS